MSRILKVLLFAVISICFLNLDEVYAEWELTEEIFLGSGQGSGFWNEGFAYNPVTKLMYIGHDNTKNISVIDSETFTTINYINSGKQSMKMVVDKLGNKIYTIEENNFGVTIIDGYTNNILIKNNLLFDLKGTLISDLAIDEERRKIYIGGTYIDTEDDNAIVYDLCIFAADTLDEIDRIEIARRYLDYRSIFVRDAKITFDQKANRIYFAHTGPRRDLNDNPDTEDDFISVIDGDDYHVITTVPVGNHPNNILVNPNTRLVYVFNRISATVSVIDQTTNQVIKTIDEDIVSFGRNDVAIDIIHNKIYVGSSGKIISGITNSVSGRLSNSDTITGIAVDEFNKKVLTTYYHNTKLEVFDADNGALINSISTSDIAVYSFASLGSLNKIFFIPVRRKQLNVMDLNNNSALDPISSEHDLEKVIQNSKNGLIYVADSHNISAYNPITGVFLEWVKLPGQQYDIAIDENIDRIYVAWEGNITVLDANTLEIIDTFDPGISNVWSIKVDQENHIIYVPSRNENTLAVIDGITLETKMKLNIGDGYIVDVAPYPNGNKLYVSMSTLGVKILNLHTLNIISELSISVRFINVDNDTGLIYAASGSTIFFINAEKDTILQSIFTDSPIDDHIKANSSINTITGEVYFLCDEKASILVFRDSENSGYITPAAPDNLASQTTEAVITISWTPVVHPDTRGYNIYRSLSGQDQWIRLNSELVTHTSYLDETATPNTPYDYRISTMGLYNIEGEPSEPVTATLILDPDFTLSPVLASQSASLNSTTDYYITSKSIEQFASLIDLSVEGLPEGVDYTIDPNPLRPGEVSLLSCLLSPDVTSGTYDFEVIGTAGDIEHRVTMKLRVVETDLTESVVTLDMSSPDIEFGSAVYATGRIIPAVSNEVSVTFTSIHGTETMTATSSSDGTYSIDFEPPSAGEWIASASWPGNATYAGAESEAQSFEALSGRTKITCTTDAPADAEVGWQMTIKGKVFPNPEIGSVTLYVTKPDGTDEEIDGLMINELGYYGYNITADQPGFWEVTASWAGNDRYLGSVSETLVVPYGLDIGRAIIAVCPSDSRPFYSTANRLGRLAYKTFASRRFDAPRIQYFDVNENQDLNEDGFVRDVEGPPTLTNI
ncbi:MAG: hypothetical protein HOC71_07920, partial [Candidatus Latescibacteria bacterium]|nr:hypothetical protein [Candidatus Latescibacterota bacterium]